VRWVPVATLASALPGWRFLVLVLAATPLAYYVAATLAALRFFTRERARELAPYAPAVSLLKPVRGLDFGSYENFASFCRQEYPEYEIFSGSSRISRNDGSGCLSARSELAQIAK
jgi:hypothetical protein